MTAQDIKKLRRELGWSQQKFAVEVGVAVSTVSGWERGLSEPLSVFCDKMAQIAEKHGISVG